MSFETIVASGVRSALPHGRATAARLPRRGFLTLDFGIILGWLLLGYDAHGALGASPNRKSAVPIDAVLEAEQAGSCGGERRRDVRRTWTRQRVRCCAGPDWPRFTHSTGHGVGLEIHEGPRLCGETESRCWSRDGGYDRAGSLSAGRVWNSHRRYGGW